MCTWNGWSIIPRPHIAAREQKGKRALAFNCCALLLRGPLSIRLKGRRRRGSAPMFIKKRKKLRLSDKYRPANPRAKGYREPRPRPQRPHGVRRLQVAAGDNALVPEKAPARPRIFLGRPTRRARSSRAASFLRCPAHYEHFAAALVAVVAAQENPPLSASSLRAMPRSPQSPRCYSSPGHRLPRATARAGRRRLPSEPLRPPTTARAGTEPPAGGLFPTRRPNRPRAATRWA